MINPNPVLRCARRGRIAALVILIAGGILLFQYRDTISTQISKVLAATEDDPIPVTKLSRQPFLLTVPATGEVVGLETTPVAVPNTPSGSLKLSWLIPEGRFVRAGEPVVRFDSTDAKLSLEKQQNTLDANQENTKIKTLNIVTNDKVLGFDRTSAELQYDYDMTVMPQDETIFSKWDIITAQADANYDKERIDFLKSKGKTQERIARSDQQILAIERNRAQAEVKVIQTTLDSLELRPSVPGLVLYRRDRRQDPQIGDDCQPGQVMVELVNLDVLQARIYVLGTGWRKSGKRPVGCDQTGCHPRKRISRHHPNRLLGCRSLGAQFASSVLHVRCFHYGCGEGPQAHSPRHESERGCCA